MQRVHAPVTRSASLYVACKTCVHFCKLGWLFLNKLWNVPKCTRGRHEVFKHDTSSSQKNYWRAFASRIMKFHIQYNWIFFSFIDNMQWTWELNVVLFIGRVLLWSQSHCSTLNMVDGKWSINALSSLTTASLFLFFPKRKKSTLADSLGTSVVFQIVGKITFTFFWINIKFCIWIKQRLTKQFN